MAPIGPPDPPAPTSMGKGIGLDKQAHRESERKRLENVFSYHRPQGTQQPRYETLREKAKELALTINDLCPDSREKSLALTNLQQTVMWANASIAINENPVE